MAVNGCMPFSRAGLRKADAVRAINHVPNMHAMCSKIADCTYIQALRRTAISRSNAGNQSCAAVSYIGLRKAITCIIARAKHNLATAMSYAQKAPLTYRERGKYIAQPNPMRGIMRARRAPLTARNRSCSRTTRHMYRRLSAGARCRAAARSSACRSALSPSRRG